MSESDQDTAAPAPAKNVIKKVATPIKKQEEYRAAARKQFGLLGMAVFDFMCLKPSVQASYINPDDVVVGDREDLLTFGKENWTRPDDVPEDKKWTQTGALEDTIKSLSKLAPKTGDDEHRVIYMKRHIAVYAIVKMPNNVPEFGIMGYLTSAVADEPRMFHPFASKQLAVFHNKNFDRLVHLRDETQDLESLEIDDVTFDYIEFDFRYCIYKWLENQRALEKTAAAAAAAAVAESENVDMEDAEPVEEEKEEPPKKTITTTKKKSVTTGTGGNTSKASNGKKLAPTLDDPRLKEFERRNASAARELAKILHNPDSGTRAAILGPITDPPLSISDTKRISFFPNDFHVDMEFLSDPENLNAERWETRKVCMAIMASCMVSRYNVQGLLTYSLETGIEPRSDTIPNWVSSWENHALGGKWDSAKAFAEMAVAHEFTRQLARANSAVIKRGMAFRMAAQLTVRVLRIREVTTYRGFPGIYCCITNEPISEGTRCDAWDLELNPLYLPEGMPTTMTLLVKQKASRACPLFPVRKKSVGDGSKSPARPKSPAKKQDPVESPAKKSAAPSDFFGKKRKAPEPAVEKKEEEEEEEIVPPKAKKARIEKEPTPAPITKKPAVEKFIPAPEFINVWPEEKVVHGTALWHAFHQSWIKKELEENKDFVNMIALVMSANDSELKKNLPPMTKESMWALFDIILEFIKPRTAVVDIEAAMLATAKKPEIESMDFMELLDMVGGGEESDEKNTERAPQYEYRTNIPDPSAAILSLYNIANKACEAGKRPTHFPMMSELFPTPDAVLKTPNTLHHMAFVAVFSE